MASSARQPALSLATSTCYKFNLPQAIEKGCSLGQSEVIEIKLCLLRILHMFSMDGDFGPLLELIKLHRMYGLLLVMDVPWTVGDHCDVGVIGLTKCSGTHGLLPCFDTFLLVSIQRETICVHPLDFMIWVNFPLNSTLTSSRCIMFSVWP
nr:uncharacterized protein LOC4346933 [Oryza sativa Japonica Group]